MKIYVYILIVFCLLSFVSCSVDDGQGSENQDEAQKITETKKEELFSNKDYDTDTSSSSPIILKENDATADSSGVDSKAGLVTINDGGTYTISGAFQGMIVVNAKDSDKPHIILNGAEIISDTSAAIYVKNADKVFITLSEGSVNKLSNGGSFTAIDDSNIDSVIFSRSDLTLNGAGSLEIISPAGHGIVSKDDLSITGGIYNITSASHGLSANDCVAVTGASITLNTGKDGIHCENTADTSLGSVYLFDGEYSITSSGDGISSSAELQITGGTFDISSGGGAVNGEKKNNSYGGFPGRPGSSSSSDTDTDSESRKGIKCTGTLLIKGENINIDSADDAIHSNSTVLVEGGEFKISTGDDAFHADTSLTISGGKIAVSESYEGLEAEHITISGGDITIKASDDGINASGGNDGSGYGGFGGPGDRFGSGSSSTGSITISGGSVYVNASGDGIDANGFLTISGGYTVVCGPTSGDTSVLDYDNSANITGGTFIGTGAYQMAQTFSDSGQGVLSVSVGSMSAETPILLTSSSEETLINYTPSLGYQIIIISTPSMVKGESYTITVGEASASFNAQ